MTKETSKIPGPSERLFYRSFEVERAGLNEETREISLSFSSDEPAERWFGKEILRHGRGNVDLTRLNTMGAVLFNHNPYNIVGPVKTAAIAGSRGKATISFDDDDDGNRAMFKVKSGSLRGVSVGYMINKARRVMDGEEFEGVKGPALIALKWTPYEISLTPIPVDASVGVGRSAVRSLDGIEIENEPQGEKEMDKEEVRAIFKEMVGDIPKAADIVTAVRAALAEDAKPKMRIDTEAMLDLTGRAGAVSLECKSMVMDMALAGKTEGVILRAITDAATKRPDASDTGDLGGGGTGMGTDRGKLALKNIDDDLFVRSLTAPQTFVN